MRITVPVVLEHWSYWIALRGAGQNQQVPARPGLYRVRRKMNEQEIDYIGQTGASLRGRLGQLNGLYRAEMPYNDPHTAAPALWALRHRDACDFEVSVTEMRDTPPNRKALEAVAITLYRSEYGHSPLANFGGMPADYRKSTGNNRTLVASGRRARGGPDPNAPIRADSTPVAGELGDNPQSPDWMSWPWNPWTPAIACKDAQCTGLYRLRRRDHTGLVYVGQGKVSSRIPAHLAKASLDGHRQAVYFSSEIEASWVALPSVARRNLLEYENDLIAAHVLTLGYPPQAQFLG
jgi:hypothetical protein